MDALLVAHSPTRSLTRLRRAVLEAVRWEGLQDVRLRDVDALEATAEDVLLARAVLLLTPVNLGYISGALKHFFDSTFRDLEERTQALPFGAVIKGTTDATGAVRAVESITTGLRWRQAAPFVVIEGDVDSTVLSATTEMAATVLASARPV